MYQFIKGPEKHVVLNWNHFKQVHSYPRITPIPKITTRIIIMIQRSTVVHRLAREEITVLSRFQVSKTLGKRHIARHISLSALINTTIDVLYFSFSVQLFLLWFLPLFDLLYSPLIKTMVVQNSPLKSQKAFSIIQVLLRTLAFATTLSALWLMLTSRQSTEVFAVKFEAKYSYSPAFK